MKNNSFLIALSKISKEDFKSFHKYSTSLYNDKSAANKVLTYLKRFHPQFDSYHLDERYAYKKIFQGELFKEQKIGNAISDLRKRLVEFLYWQNFKKNSLEKEFLVLDILEEFQLTNLAKKQYNTIQSSLANSTQYDMWFWMNKLKLAHISYFNHNLDKISKQSDKMKTIMSELDAFHGIAKLQYSSELLGRKYILKDSLFEVNFLNDLMKEDWSKTSLLHETYQAVILLNTDREDANYFLLRDKVTKGLTFFSKKDKHILITYLTNYAAFRIREGIVKFADEIFKLYKLGIKHQAFIIEGYFHDIHFGNIVDAGCRLNQYQWSEQFIEHWGYSLNDEFKEEIINFSRAFILHEKKEYNKALKILSQDFKKNLFYSVKAKWLELVCLFEIDENSNYILDRHSAFKQYLRRNDLIHESLKIGMLAFLKIFLLLLNPNKKKEELIKQLQRSEYISYQSWLVKKIEKLD